MNSTGAVTPPCSWQRGPLPSRRSGARWRPGADPFDRVWEEKLGPLLRMKRPGD